VATGGDRGCREAPETVDFFISYSRADEAWATWAAHELEMAGQTVTVQAWDSLPGDNFVLWISAQMQAARRTVALFSPAYFDSHWCSQEWTAALASRKLIPLRVVDCPVPALLANISYRDLHGLDEGAARRRLLEAAGLTPITRSPAVGFPGNQQPARAPFPGTLPPIFEVPARNRHFTGRRVLLDQLQTGLSGGRPVAVTALHGLGGVGKTQLAIEYAHRHAANYQIVWWIDAEEITLVTERLAALAPRIDAPVTGDVTIDVKAVLDALRRRAGWLLVFDNAESPTGLRHLLPDGPGHVLITSRYPGWGGLADRLEVDVLTRPDAVTLLGRRISGINPTTADALVAELGDLPLAVEQVAAYLETTDLPPEAYLAKFRARRAQMLTRGQDLAHGGSIGTLWSLAIDELRVQAPAAVDLLELCAHLGPEPIPLALFGDHPDLLEAPLREVVADTGAAGDLDDVVGAVLAYSLVRRNRNTIQLHRLVAAVIRAHQPADRYQKATKIIRALLVAHQPDHPQELGETWRDPTCWPRWSVLASQALTAPALHPDDLVADMDDDARSLMLRTVLYLHARGDFRAVETLASALHTRWTATLGPDHNLTLSAATMVAFAHRAAGNYQSAYELDKDIYTRRRRVGGEDNPATLGAANDVAVDLRNLGDHQAAHDLNLAALTRTRELQGDDHPYTLTMATDVAIDLRNLGDHQAAHDLDQDTWARRQRTLGEDHPDTLSSAANLALDLLRLGEGQAARELAEDTLSRRRRVLGDDHPDTLHNAHELAVLLENLGDQRAARELAEDTLSRRRRVLGDDHLESLQTRQLLARILRAPKTATES